MSRDEKSDEVKDRLAGRFDSSAEDQQEQTDNRENHQTEVESANSEKPDNQQNLDKPENLENPDNIDNTDNLDNLDERDIDPKEDWTGRMVYVPNGEAGAKDLLDAFDGEYDRLQYECDWDIRKQLHYYPVVVTHGIRKLKDMDGHEFTEAVDDLGLRNSNHKVT